MPEVPQAYLLSARLLRRGLVQVGCNVNWKAILVDTLVVRSICIRQVLLRLGLPVLLQCLSHFKQQQVLRVLALVGLQVRVQL